MGIPEFEAKRYEGRIKNGGILVSVHCDNSEWVSKAQRARLRAAKRKGTPADIRAGRLTPSPSCACSLEAKQILKHTGGEDVSSAGEASVDSAESDKPMAR